jgi:arylformamidase
MSKPNTQALTRRGVLALAGAATALAARPALAQRPSCQIGPAPHTKGPAVFLDYDQPELDAAYDQLAYEPNLPEVAKRWTSDSVLARSRIKSPQRIAYGPSTIEQLDIYRAKQAAAPILVFIHGGAWRSGAASDWAFLAEPFIAAGAHFVVPDFTVAQDAGGNLNVMADQLRRSVAWTYRHAKSFGGDPARIYVAGHSSGGHLAAVVLTTDWAKDFQLPATAVRGGICLSGMYDLAPVRLSSRSNYIKFDDATVAALSPLRHLDHLTAPLIVAYGTYETPEFQRQNRDFAAAVKAAGKPVELIVAENYSHMEMPATLANRYGAAGAAARRLMKLS